MNGLEVPQLGGRESGIDDGSWAQSPESLPGLSDKLSDAMHILDSSYYPAGLLVTPLGTGNHLLSLLKMVSVSTFPITVSEL